MKAFLRGLCVALLIAAVGCGGDKPQPAATVGHLYAVGQGLNAVLALNVLSTGGLGPTSIGAFATNPRPVAMALHTSTNFLYVANLTANTVSGYSVDHTSGVLTPLGTALPPTATGPSPIALGVGSTGQFLFVLNQGDSTVSVFSIDGTRGLLTQVGTPVPTGLTNPVAMTVSPTAPLLFIATPTQISGFAIDASGGLTAAPGPFTAGTNLTGMQFDPKGQHLYAADSGANNVVSLTVAASGSLTPVAGSPFAAGTQPVAVATDATGAFVYVSNAGSNNVSGYKSNAGVLAQITGSPFSTQGAGTTAVTQPGFLTVDATNNFVYVSNIATKSIASFGINPADGSLSTITNSPFAVNVASSWLLATK